MTTAFLEPQLDRAVRWSAMRPLVARPESWPACPSIPFSGGQGAEGTDEHDPIDETGTPQSVVAFMLEQTGRTRADLAPLMGGRGRVSEFFAGKRRLSIEQIRKLRDELGIPADLLID